MPEQKLNELIIYVDVNCGGLHTHIFQSMPDATQLALGGVGVQLPGDWNDKVSSIVIKSGRWQFYRDVNFTTPVGDTLNPGVYNDVTMVGIPNDCISSVKLIGG